VNSLTGRDYHTAESPSDRCESVRAVPVDLAVLADHSMSFRASDLFPQLEAGHFKRKREM